MRKILVLIASIALLSTFNGRTAGLPEKLRVLSVDLENALIQRPGVPGGELAQDLRTLLEKADPDVICLQGAIDWESCDRICKLKPGLRVLTCSAFPAKSEGAAAPQVAILARDRAVISWVEEIADGGGFAFAVLQAGSRKLGVFSLQSVSGPAGPSVPSTDRLIAEINKLQKFPQNRPDSFLIAGSPLVKSSVIIDAGLQTISVQTQATNTPLRSEFWVANAGFIARPRAVTISGLRAPAVVCDFDSGSSYSSKFAYQTPLLFAGETPASLEPPVAAVAPVAPVKKTSIWPIATTSIAGFLLLLVLFRWNNSSTQMQLVPLNPHDAITPGNPALNDSTRTHLLDWFKSLFVQRLLSQRQQLLSAENEATRRTLVIEEKLSSLQTTLQGRISAYEARIERLEQELTAANVENRDLIRSQIDLLKEKVAKAKEEHAFRRN